LKRFLKTSFHDAVDVTTMTKKSSGSIRIQESRPDDLPFVRALALEAFSIYGDYETILTDFFLQEGVHTYVAEKTDQNDTETVGLLMMVIRKPRWRGPHIAQILAIAVAQAHQNQGIGSAMIEFAKEWPRSFAGILSVPETHLSVAEPNTRGRAFFERHGFSVIREEPWRYPAGQRALRMRYVIKT
jgi:ribosomal protein S18 acetylase RimI-like enzyme